MGRSSAAPVQIVARFAGWVAVHLNRANWGAIAVRVIVVSIWVVRGLYPHPWKAQGCGTQRPSWREIF